MKKPAAKYTPTHIDFGMGERHDDIAFAEALNALQLAEEHLQECKFYNAAMEVFKLHSILIADKWFYEGAAMKEE